MLDDRNMVYNKQPVRTVLISLYSLSDIGGGERYTLNTIRAIQAGGDECTAYAVVRPCSHQPYPQRLATQFVRVVAEEPPKFQEIVSLRDLQIDLANYDTVVIHQYLSSEIVFDLIANCASDQTVICTNLGHEPLLRDFEACFQPSSSCWFIEISDFSARRAARFSRQARSITGAIWCKDIRPFQAPPAARRFGGRLCSVGRILAHKGLEVTMAGTPEDCELIVVGPQYDQAYWRYLESRRGRKKITFAGAVSEARKCEIVGEADALIASSHYKLYDGRVLEQAELLGLVIFEALALNTLPITSDIPPFREIMEKLGLPDLLYEASEAASLAKRMEYFRSVAPAELATKLQHARQQMLKQYLWDDYWTRVKTAIGI